MAEKARSIRVRLSEGEWQSVKDRAAALGCSASSYVRHAVAAYALASDEAGGCAPSSPTRGRPGSARWASSGTPWRTPTSVRQSWPGASPTWRSGSRRSWLRRGGAAERLRRACWVRARGRGHGGLGPRLCRLVFEGAEERGRPCAGACAEGDGERPSSSRPGLFSAVWISVRWAGRIVADGDPTPEMWGSAVLYG